MSTELIIQYALVGLLVAFACYSLIKTIKKKVSSNKKGDNEPHCDNNCGCS